MKEEYESIEIEIIVFDTEDVIEDSLPIDPNGSGGGEGQP